MRLTRILTASALGATLGVGLFTAGPAFAATTSDGAMFCPFEGAQVNPDGSTEIAVEANGAGCVLLRAAIVGSSNTVAVDQVVLAPGWTDEIKKGGPVQIDVRFTQPSTGDRVEVRTRLGEGIEVR